MYLITFRPDTRRITSAGVINPTYALPTLPDGAAYSDTLPDGNVTDYLLSESGDFVLSKEDNDARDQN